MPCRCMRVINMIISHYVLINNRMAIKTNCHIRIEVHRDADIRTESAERIGCHQVRVDGDRDDEYGSAIYCWRMSFALTFLSFLWRWVSQHKVTWRWAVVWLGVTRRAHQFCRSNYRIIRRLRFCFLNILWYTMRAVILVLIKPLPLFLGAKLDSYRSKNLWCHSFYYD